jgi:hypothetical protein
MLDWQLRATDYRNSCALNHQSAGVTTQGAKNDNWIRLLVVIRDLGFFEDFQQTVPQQRVRCPFERIKP